MIRVLLSLSSPAMRAGLRALLSLDKTIKVVNDSLDEGNEADVVITSASPASFSDGGLGDSPSALRHGSHRPDALSGNVPVRVGLWRVSLPLPKPEPPGSAKPGIV